MLPLSVYSFVIREGFSIVVGFPAWLLLAILTDHCHVTGLFPGVVSSCLFPGVVSSFVIREGSGIPADLSA